MFKRLFLSVGLIVGLFSPLYAAGTIPLSLTQQFDSLGAPLNGGLLYTIQAGTDTPQSAYQDSALTILHSNPVTLDAAGRIPQLFFADGSIKIRLTNSAGTTQLAVDGILVVGASSGGGGGSPVDATTILATGDFKLRHGTGALSGFVRANGRTIGSVTSGATERANADTQALFEYLWDADAALVVSGGRGANAAADWGANKSIALPDYRGRAPIGLADMGNSATAALTVTYCGNVPTVLGSPCGTQSFTQTSATMPSHTHTFTGDAHQHTFTYGTLTTDSGAGGSVVYRLAGTGGTTQFDSNVVSTGSNSSTGSGTAHSLVQPSRLVTVYLKM